MLLELRLEARPQAGGAKLADDFAVLVHALFVEAEQFLHDDAFAFHARHFGDRDDFSRAVAQARLLHDQLDGAGASVRG